MDMSVNLHWSTWLLLAGLMVLAWAWRPSRG